MGVDWDLYLKSSWISPVYIPTEIGHARFLGAVTLKEALFVYEWRHPFCFLFLLLT